MRIPGRYGLSIYNKITGRNIVPRFNELLQSQQLSAEELKALQMRRLQALLRYAYAYVPYYQRVFDKVGFRPSELARDPDSFQSIPPVSKAEMRVHAEEFLTTDPNRRRALSQDTTTGSTGEPFVFWEDHQTQDYAVANTFRHHTWCGWQPGQPRVYLWPADLQQPDFKSNLRENMKNFFFNRSFFDTNLSEETMEKLANLIRKRKPQLLHGYPTPLSFFAQFVQEKGWNDIKLPAVYTTSEVLYPHQRKRIEEAFGCKVFNRYATQEVSGIACECEKHTNLHISTETNYVEILNEAHVPVEDGQAGNVVVTNLTNYGFPFIRYCLKDISRMSTRQCPCGRHQPMLEIVEGRVADMFKTRDGRSIMGNTFSELFEVEGVKQFKVIQKSLDLITVQLATGDTFQETGLDFIKCTIKATMGAEINVHFEMFDSIPPEASRKYRYAICELD